MTILPDLFMRALRLLSVVALLALSACGPGTGGTGTGPNASVASYSGMVGSSFGAGAAAAGIVAGLPCSDDCPAVSLQVESTRVELSAPCHRFVHEGGWSIDAAGLAVVQGQLETTTIVNSQPRTDTAPAVMRLEFSEAQADSRQVMLTVRDAGGRNLLSPLTLQRGEKTSAKISCAPAP